MKTLVVGNTGFLGYYIVQTLLANGHDVTGVSLTPASEELPDLPQVRQVLADLGQLSDEELLALLEGMEGFPMPRLILFSTRQMLKARAVWFGSQGKPV